MSRTSSSSPALSFVDSTPLLGDADALRRRAEDEGYLFFRGLLPAEDVLRVRADALAVVEHSGWRQAGQGIHGGLINTQALRQVPESDMRLDIGVTHAAYDDVQKLESLHRLPHHPHLIALYQTLFGGAVLVHCALPWEDIYADWAQDDLKYYWREFPLALSAWNDSLIQPGRRIC